MRRIILLVLALMLLACGAWAEDESSLMKDLYELNADETVLTVRMPANEAEGYRWNFEISNPDLLEMITAEDVQAPELSPEGQAIMTGEWCGSFKSATTVEGEGGSVSLTLRNVLSSDPDAAEPAMCYVLDIWVVENGQLDVTGSRLLEPIVTE